jgi:hypothetical protein
VRTPTRSIGGSGVTRSAPGDECSCVAAFCPSGAFEGPRTGSQTSYFRRRDQRLDSPRRALLRCEKRKRFLTRIESCRAPLHPLRQQASRVAALDAER